MSLLKHFCVLEFRAHNKINKLDSIDLENLPNLEILDMNKNKLVFLDDHAFPQSIKLRILLV